MSSKNICKIECQKLLDCSQTPVEHAIWLRETFPKSAVKFIYSFSEYLYIKTQLEALISYGAKSKSEALFLFTTKQTEPPKCDKCDNFRSYTISGKSEYPRLSCGPCLISANAKRLLNHKNKIGLDGLTGHQRTAYKASETKKSTINGEGLNTFQVDARKAAGKKAKSMAQYVAKANILAANGKDDISMLYVIHDLGINAFKIGISKNALDRVARIQHQIGRQIRIVYIGNDLIYNISKLEQMLHEYFEEDNILQPKGFPGRTEWFSDKIEDELNTVLEDLTIDLIYFKGTQNGIILPQRLQKNACQDGICSY